MIHSSSDSTACEKTRMFIEASDSSEALRSQSNKVKTQIDRLGTYLRGRSIPTVMTCGRGSSGHAATYAKYMIETRLGIPTLSAAPSAFSLYGSSLNLRDGLCLIISQSGRSPDLLATAKGARNAGAFVLAIVNEENSPLEQLADETVHLCAGQEYSVAATKTFISSLAIIAKIVASWGADDNLLSAIDDLPESLQEAWLQDWSRAIPRLTSARSVFHDWKGHWARHRYGSSSKAKGNLCYAR